MPRISQSIEHLVQLILFHLGRPLHILSVFLCEKPAGITLAVLGMEPPADLDRRDVVWVLPERGAAEAAAEYANWIHHKTGTYLCEDGAVRVFPVVFSHRGNLVVSEPYLIIVEGEGHHVVEKGLGFGVITRSAEHLREEFPQQGEGRESVEVVVERQQRPRMKQTVARHLELAKRVNVEYLEFGRGSVRHSADPHVQLAALAHLQEHTVVARFQFAQLVDVPQCLLLLPLGLAFRVRHEPFEVLHEMPVPVRDAP
mmetsp:Transcript_48807/g.122240  ORF Transcript_48807/g.122240 Transcript_48807/m.122240 type:complete len:256 (+) Transcript_48807:303-1070(+)